MSVPIKVKHVNKNVKYKVRDGTRMINFNSSVTRLYNKNYYLKKLYTIYIIYTYI